MERPQRSNPPAPLSFEIRGAVGSSVSAQPRWDRINSAAVIAQARRIYFQFLERSTSALEPQGIVLSPGQGRVVFELPVLLPDEQFIPLDWVRARPSRSRTSRSPYRGL